MLERSNMSKVFTHAAGMTGLLHRRLRFRVTPKGAHRTPFGVYAPHVVLLALTAAAVAWGTYAYKTGVVDYGGAGLGVAMAFLLNVGWALWNFGIAGSVVHASVRTHERRSDHRFSDAVPVLFGAEGGVAVDVNGGGMRLRTLARLAKGEVHEFVLHLADGSLRLLGRVVHVGADTRANGDVCHGIEFVAPGEAALRRIDMHCTHHSVPRQRAALREVEDIFDRVLRPSRHVSVELNLLAHIGAARNRQQHGMPVVLQRVDGRAIQLLSRHPVRLRRVWVQVAGMERRVLGRIVAARMIRTAAEPAHLLEVRLRESNLLTSVAPRAGARKDLIMMENTLPHANSRTARAVAVVIGMLLATVIGAASAAGQLTGGAMASAEAARDDRSFLLAGGWVTEQRTGWVPVGSVIGYRLGFNEPAGSRTLWGLNPSVGLRRAGTAGDLQGSVGYAWQWDDGAGAQVPADLQRVTAGATTALQANYWGDGSRAGQAIVSYSWGGDGYVWSQLQGSQRVATLAGMPLRLGAEVTAQGNRDITAFGAGPLLELPASTHVVSLASGIRRVDDGTLTSNQWYVRIGLVLLR
jgi:hypothetical protein